VMTTLTNSSRSISLADVPLSRLMFHAWWYHEFRHFGNSHMRAFATCRPIIVQLYLTLLIRSSFVRAVCNSTLALAHTMGLLWSLMDKKNRYDTP
jgi:hypothetical protein